ncbi:hypothetical protein D3C87_1467870 [compost metagenome]
MRDSACFEHGWAERRVDIGQAIAQKRFELGRRVVGARKRHNCSDPERRGTGAQRADELRVKGHVAVAALVRQVGDAIRVVLPVRTEAFQRGPANRGLRGVQQCKQLVAAEPVEFDLLQRR